jgi:hypothetical protein
MEILDQRFATPKRGHRCGRIVVRKARLTEANHDHLSHAERLELQVFHYRDHRPK